MIYSLYSDDLNLGIWLYDKKIHPSDIHETDPRTYKVVLQAELQKALCYRLNMEELLETVTIIATFCINDYIIVSRVRDKVKNELYCRTEFNVEKFVSDYGDALELNEIESRLTRYYYGDIPPVNMMTEYDAEFFEFDDSHWSLCSSFKLNEKQGGAITVNETNSNRMNRTELITRSFCDAVSKYDFPRHYTKDRAKELDSLYPMSRDEKIAYFQSLPIDIFHSVYCKTMKSFTDAETRMAFLPYSVYLFGTDDTSYTKWFHSMADVEIELNYLRRMQPLNLSKDFHNRGYVFTN